MSYITFFSSNPYTLKFIFFLFTYASNFKPGKFLYKMLAAFILFILPSIQVILGMGKYFGLESVLLAKYISGTKLATSLFTVPTVNKNEGFA